MDTTIGALSFKSPGERRVEDDLLDQFRKCPIPDGQILENLGLFLSSKNLARILFMDHLYRQIVETPGIVIEFGTRWGQNLALFAALRGIYEPFHRHRKLVGFDTFTGFPSVSAHDGVSDLMKVGNIATTPEYVGYLQKIMECHEALNPLAHLKKWELRAGDATRELPAYLEANPETIVALAYFDFDLYEPTKQCLEAVRPHLVKGSVLGFDELNDHDSPGETRALAEVFGLSTIRLVRSRYTSRTAYFIVE